MTQLESSLIITERIDETQLVQLSMLNLFILTACFN